MGSKGTGFPGNVNVSGNPVLFSVCLAAHVSGKLPGFIKSSKSLHAAPDFIFIIIPLK